VGTSSAFGGASGQKPLIPSWLTDDGFGAAPQATPPVQPAVPTNGAPTALPAAPAERTPVVPSGDSERYSAARNSFTRFAGSGGSDSRSLGRALSHYVARSMGGSSQAAIRMGNARASTANLASFLSDARVNGAQAALRTLNLERLAGRPIEEIFIGLSDYICPEGGSIDEGISRDAFMETIADLTAAGISNIDGLTPDQIQTVLELYITHAIEARLCNDIGIKAVTFPSDITAAERVQAQLRDFIRRGVSDAVTAVGVNVLSFSREQVMNFVTGVYQSAFDILLQLGEQEAQQ